MDPINILTGIVFVVTFAANFSGAKKGAKSSLTNVKKRPETFLQKVPPNISMLVLLLILLGIFGIGAYPVENTNQFLLVRLTGVVMFAVFSGLQVWASKSLGEYYTHEVVLLKNQALKKKLLRLS